MFLHSKPVDGVLNRASTQLSREGLLSLVLRFYSGFNTAVLNPHLRPSDKTNLVLITVPFPTIKAGTWDHTEHEEKRLSPVILWLGF